MKTHEDFGTIKYLHGLLGLMDWALHYVLDREGRHKCEWSLFCFAGEDNSVNKRNQVSVRFSSLPEITTNCGLDNTVYLGKSGARGDSMFLQKISHGLSPFRASAISYF